MKGAHEAAERAIPAGRNRVRVSAVPLPRPAGIAPRRRGRAELLEGLDQLSDRERDVLRVLRVGSAWTSAQALQRIRAGRGKARWYGLGARSVRRTYQGLREPLATWGVRLYPRMLGLLDPLPDPLLFLLDENPPPMPPRLPTLGRGPGVVSYMVSGGRVVLPESASEEEARFVEDVEAARAAIDDFCSLLAAAEGVALPRLTGTRLGQGRP